MSNHLSRSDLWKNWEAHNMLLVYKYITHCVVEKQLGL